VAEQFALQQLGGNRRGVERDEGTRARGDSRCSARATSSLPVPVSPVISTDSGACASRPMARNSARIAGASPTSCGECRPPAAWRCRRAISSACGSARAGQRDGVVQVEGLGQEFVRAAAERTGGAGHVGIARHHDHRQVRVRLLELVEQHQAVCRRACARR
jgi:hypothetical protein